MAAAALGAATFTALVIFVHQFDVAYRSPGMHVSLETVAAVIAAVAAYLFFGRYRLSAQLTDLLLALSLLVLAIGSVFFSVLPAALSGLRVTHFSTWAPVMSGLLGAFTLALQPGIETTTEARDALRRIAREATNNATRHGQATHIHVRLDARPRGIALRVEDNGTGFDPARPSDGFGLRSMRERATSLGGTLELSSEPGVGTTLEVLLPRDARRLAPARP